MEYVKVVQHKGKDIVQINVSTCPTLEVPGVLQQAHQIIKKSAPKSALVYTDVTGAAYTKEVANAMKDFTRDNTPYIKASAVKGADGVRMVLLQTVALLTKRDIKMFDNEASALDWLVSV